MLRYVILLLLALSLPSWADIECSSGTWSGTTCTAGVRPLTYHAKCTGDGIITTSEIQAVVNDRRRGDTLMVYAFDDTNTNGVQDGGELSCKIPDAGTPIIMRRESAGGTPTGSFLITTDQYAKLPPTGTRISPAYRSLMPTFECGAGCNSGQFIIAGNAYPANNITFRGLRFIPKQDLAYVPFNANVHSAAGIALGRAGGVASSEYSLGNVAETTMNTASSAGASSIVVNDASLFTANMKISVNAGGLGTCCGGTNEPAEIDTIVGNTLNLKAALIHPHGVGQPVGSRVDGPEDQPDNIVIEHCLFEDPSRLHRVGRWIMANSRSTIIRDNYISGPKLNAGEAQAILITAGKGPYTIANNFLDADGENIMSGGGAAPFDDVASDVDFLYNYLPALEEREQHGPWTWTQDAATAGPLGSSRLVFAGRYVFGTGTSNGSTGKGWFMAINTGIVGTVEPDWNSVPTNGTIVDGTVTWVHMGTNAKPANKNRFEIKAGKRWRIRYNVFDRHFYQDSWNSSQPHIMVIKSNPYAHIWAAAQNEACNGGGLSVDWATGCHLPDAYDIDIAHNYFRGISGGISMMGSQNGPPPANLGNYTVRHNLFTRTQAAPTAAATRYTWLNINPSANGNFWAAGYDYRGAPVSNIVIEHNTFYDPFASAVQWLSTDATTEARFPGALFRHNVSMWGSGAGSTGVTTYPGTSKFTSNVVVGAPTTGLTATLPVGTISLCSTTAACPQLTALDTVDPTYGRLFLNHRAGKFRIQRNVRADSTTGTDSGAEMSLIPQILNLTVTATDRVVVFRYQLPAPIEAIPCVAEVNTSPDMAGTYLGEMSNPAVYYGRDSDNHDAFPRSGDSRVIVVGQSVAVPASTVLYWRLQCGGMTERGTVTTLATQSGTANRTISRRIANAAAQSMVVEYGTAYSRATDIISGGGTASANCTQGQTCAPSFTGTRGQTYYVRWYEKSATGGGGSTLLTGRVGVVAVQ